MKSFFLTPEQYGELKGRYANFNEPWTEEDAEALRRMAADGITRADMSQQLGRTPGAIKMKLQSMGLYVPKPAARPWSASDDASLVRQYLAGASFDALANAFSRTERAIIARLILLRAGLREEIPATEAEIPPVEDIR